jgi:erbb2-interacting protein
MVKTVQTIVHRLKDEETNEESGRDLKQHEDQQVVNKDKCVKVRKLNSN